jgi:hypothetical protein
MENERNMMEKNENEKRLKDLLKTHESKRK